MRSATTANLAALAGRILQAVMFVLAGFRRIAGFEGTVGYVASKDLPLPAVLAATGGLLRVFAFGAGA